jgi:hypothetical protein
MMRAKIHWKKKEEGGRSSPPPGVGHPPYSTVVGFKGAAEPWPPADAWSLVIEKIPELSTEYDWVANVGFLMTEAPASELRLNREFELFEGKKCVATGVTVEGKVALRPQKTA